MFLHLCNEGDEICGLKHCENAPNAGQKNENAPNAGQKNENTPNAGIDLTLLFTLEELTQNS